MKKFKKIAALALAAVTAVSAISITAMAEESINAEEIDFYNTVQILTFNPETEEFDSRYEKAPDVSLATVGDYKYTFSQTITTSGNFLKNLEDGNESYLLTDDDTMVLRLDSRPSSALTLQICKNDGTAYGPYREISTRTTVVEMDGLSEYYNRIGSCKVKLTAVSSSVAVSGTISEN